jgi:hypothetical protein
MKIEVLYRHGSFFIRDCSTGHTRPATTQELTARCGDGFVFAVMATPGWLGFDSTENARAEMMADPLMRSFEAGMSMLDDLPPAA